jgi:uncharacterized membrane protein
MIYLLCLLIGVVAGLRAATALAAVSWGAYLGWIDLSGTPASFVGHIVTALVLTVAAIGEFITDQLPGTPSRKVPVQFAARIVVGGICGALLAPQAWLAASVLGAVGAIIGTFGGAAGRARLAAALGRDRPAAIVEDVLAVAAGLLIVFLA